MKPIGLDGPIKIGCSETPMQRLETLACWSPFPLEVIGSVVGSFEDEKFLHHCFADHHSHREWFRSSEKLRNAIAEILHAGSVDAIRGRIEPVGSIRVKYGHAARSPEQKLCTSYKMKLIWAEKRLRKMGEDTRWHAPADVEKIMSAWDKRTSTGGNMQPPPAAEMARLDEFLENPQIHSVFPSWRMPKGIAA